MSKPIYKVTSKKATELITKELKRKDRFLKGLTKKALKVVPGVVAVTYRSDAWDGKIYPGDIVFDSEVKVDHKVWKKGSKVLFKGHYVDSFWPKRNNKAGKEFSALLTKALPSDTFFQGKDIADILKYAPKEKTTDITANSITVNTLSFGYKKTGKDYTFMFGGYEGYKAPRGVKEMLTSEYNKFMKGK